MTTFTVFLGGNLQVTDRLKKQIKNSRFIAADSGIYHARTLNVMPELWLGDFDSSNPCDFDEFKNVPRETFPVAKDATDGELAIREAKKRGASNIILCGAFGGLRTDHALLHMTYALSLAKTGMPVFLTSGNEEGWPVLPGQTSYDFAKDMIISIIGFSPLEGLSLQGTKWTLDNENVSFGSSLTLSNVSTGKVEISLQKGYGILLAAQTQ